MGEFRMPSLGADMDRGTLVEWRVAVGDRVHRGDLVAVVDTDKATIDVEVFEDGVIEALLVEPGTNVPVGTALAVIGTGAPATPPLTAPPAPSPPVPSPPVPPVSEAPPPPAGTAPVTGGPGRHHASVVLSPLVRHLADRLQVDTSRLEGTGPGHRITRDDVERAALGPTRRISPRARRRARELGLDPAVLTPGPGGAIHERDVTGATSAGPAAPAGPEDRRRAARSATARSMERANREIPHYHLASTVDLDPVLSWLADRNKRLEPDRRVIPAVLLLRAVALATRSHPDLNGWWQDGDLVPSDTVDVGVAVALRTGGLVTPTITGADRLGAEQLMDRLRELVERARRSALRTSDLATASITVTNLGDRGAELVHGVIHPPQVALVGFGRIVTRPWVVDGAVVPRRVVTATLAGDHRASDGRTGSRFLAAVERLLLTPERLWDEPSPEGNGGAPDGP